jgi:hypothetical protein
VNWIEVKQIEPKVWGLFVAGSLLGTSKSRFDADHGKVILENALERVQKNMDGLETSVPDATGFSGD